MPFDAEPCWSIEICLAALFGALIGSFLNVCILRWGAEPKESIIRPPSHCPRCGRGLAWYDNIPVVSWLLLRARCRGCGEPISMMYPLIELATAAHLGLHGVAPRRHHRGAPGRRLRHHPARHRHDRRAAVHHSRRVHAGVVWSSVCCSAWLVGCRGCRTALIGAAVGFGLLWLVGTVGTWVFKEDAHGRRRHQDDGDGRRLRRLARSAAHHLPRGAGGQSRLRATVAHGPEEAGSLRHLPRDRSRDSL